MAELPLLVILAVVVCLSAAADIMVAYVLKMFTDAAAGETTFPLRNIVVIAACVLVGVGITAITSAFLKAKIQGRIEINIRQQILTSVLNGEYSQVQQLHTGDTLTKLTSDAAAVAEYYPRVATDIVGSALQFLLAVIAIFLLNFKVALLITVVMPLLVLAISLANTGCQFEKTYKSKIYFGIWDGVASFLNSMVGNAILLITLGGGAYLAIKGETTVGTVTVF